MIETSDGENLLIRESLIENVRARQMQVTNAVVGLIGIVCLVYSASFGGVFVLDDWYLQNFGSDWPTWGAFWNDARQLVDLSFVANQRFGGLDPWGYHVVNLLIHLTCVLSVFSIGLWVTRRMSLDPSDARGGGDSGRLTIWPAWWIAVLWGVHPLTTESVTYIIQRYESAAVMFMLLTLRCWCGILDGKRWAILGVFAFAWGAVLSKQISISLPFLLLAWDYFFRRVNSDTEATQTGLPQVPSTARIRWIGFAGVLSAWLFLIRGLSSYLQSLLPVQSASTDTVASHYDDYGPGAIQYLQTQSVVIFHYLKLVVFPKDLRLDYGWPIETDPWRYVPAMLLLGVIGCVGFWLFLKRRIIGLLVVLTFLTLAPRSSFASSPDMVFEHRMHFPLVFIIALIVLVGIWIYRRLETKSWFVPTVACCVLFLWGLRTHQRNLNYHSPVRFWSSNFELQPNNPRVAHNLAMAYAVRADWVTAREFAERAIRLHPEFANYHLGLGDIQREQGDLEAALRSFSHALKWSPEHPEALQRRGYLLEVLGRPEAAKRDYRLAVESDNPEALFNLARLLEQENELGEALELCERLLEMGKYRARAETLRARIKTKLDEVDESPSR
jgi:hypothetical protein